MALTASDIERYEVVKAFAARALLECGDTYRQTPSPLYADAIEVRTKEHLRWRFPGGEHVVVSNLASQQNFLRLLVGLSRLGAGDHFEHAARDTVAYHLSMLRSPCGLLQWGGHRCVDLGTLQVVSAAEKGGLHELKNHLPFYELMHEVNPQATIDFVRALWNAHVYDWRSLEINRHGDYEKRRGKLWASEYEKPAPFQEAVGLSFMNAGNDLIYAAGMLFSLAGEKGAVIWMKRLAAQYFNARDPKTGLGAYQFNRAKKSAHSDDDRLTSSWYGDRAQRQLGPELGDVALEGKVLFKPQAKVVYCEHTLMMLQLCEQIGPLAGFAADWCAENLLAYARHGYDPVSNQFKPLMADGTDMSGFVLKRDGYYGSAGKRIDAYAATGEHLLAYVRCHRARADALLWRTARQIALGLDLGDIGEADGSGLELNTATVCADPLALYALLDLHSMHGNKAYLALARLLGDNVVQKHHHHGYFMGSGECPYASVDAIEPLALLALHAAIIGRTKSVPAFLNGRGFFHANYEADDGEVRMRYSNELLEAVVS